MGLNFRIQIQAEFLLMIYEGEFDSFPSLEFVTQILESCKKHQPAKVLIDFRQVEGRLSMLDRYSLAFLGAEKYYVEILAGRISTCRFAFVGHPPLVEPRKFGETVARNRGLNFKVFTEINEAYIWLEVDSPKN